MKEVFQPKLLLTYIGDQILVDNSTKKTRCYMQFLVRVLQKIIIIIDLVFNVNSVMQSITMKVAGSLLFLYQFFTVFDISTFTKVINISDLTINKNLLV